MVDCKFCDEEFESKEKLHLHWKDEHEDELNSHQEEKVKKTVRKRENRETQKMADRKRLAGQLLAGGAALVVVILLGMQLWPSGTAGSANFDIENQPMIGNESAPVTIVEFGDYQCPYCKQFDEQIYPQLKQDYIDTGKANFVFINYAFLGQDSTEAAVASECVYNQDEQQFWDFHNSLYSNQGAEHSGWVTTDKLMSIARESTEGLNYDELQACIENSETSDQVQQDKSIGDSNGVSGTPTVFVNGQKINRWNSYSSLRAAIEQRLD